MSKGRLWLLGALALVAGVIWLGARWSGSSEDPSRQEPRVLIVPPLREEEMSGPAGGRAPGAPVTTLGTAGPTFAGAAEAPLQALDTLARPASEIELRGEVLDAAGAGVAGARVELRDLLPGPWEQPVPGNLVAELSSDDEGRFGVKGCLRPGERYVLRVVHPEAAAARSQPIDPLLPATLIQVVRLGTGASIAGRVVDQRHAPLAGASVILADLDQGAQAEGLLEARSSTDAEGRFRLEHVAPGTKRLVVSLQGFRTGVRAPFLVRPGSIEERADFMLLPGVAIAGRVVSEDTGVPVPGVELRIRAVPGLADHDPGSAGRQATVLPRTPSRAENPDDHFAVSGEDGSFRFDGVEERVYVLSVLGDRTAASVNVRGGAENVVLRLRPEAVVAGRVVDGTTGEPVQRFTLVASPMADPIAVAMSRRRRFDSTDGRFAMSGIGPGSQYLLCEAAGFARTSYGPLHVGPGEHVKDLEIRLVRGGVVAGRVRGPGGAPLGGVRVILLEERESPAKRFLQIAEKSMRMARLEVRTLEDGSYAIPGVGEGRYLLEVSHPDCAPARSAPFDLAAAIELRLPDLVLEQAAALEGVVLRRSGEPDPLAIVMVVSADRADDVHQTPTDGEGRFRIRGLKPGTWRVMVVQRDGELDLQRVNQLRGGGGHPTLLRSGETKKIELKEER